MSHHLPPRPFSSFVLTLRVVRAGLQRRRHLGRLCAALPLVLILHGVWSLGECVGYLSRDPGSI
ncbi:MAG TPA: hypothetical protein VFG08_07195 [Candidatus Polarisedimenticolia bacterium]|nr:hypothetical protein [Candidatus Polarisedimenticolia bacterium]